MQFLHTLTPKDFDEKGLKIMFDLSITRRRID